MHLKAGEDAMAVLVTSLASEGIPTMDAFKMALQKFKSNSMRTKLKESSFVMFNALVSKQKCS